MWVGPIFAADGSQLRFSPTLAPRGQPPPPQRGGTDNPRQRTSMRYSLCTTKSLENDEWHLKLKCWMH